MGFFIKIIVLTFFWFILREAFSFADLIFGLTISFICIWYSRKFIPYNAVRGVSFLKLAFFVFYLLGQIYSAGFYVIKMILTGATSHIVTVKTPIKNEILRVVLADSITLMPGSILLDLNGDDITVLWMYDKEELPPDLDVKLKGKLEEKILAAQRGVDS